MLRKHILQKYILTHDILHVINHNGVVYVQDLLKAIIPLGILLFLYIFIREYTQASYVSWIFGVLGLLIRAKYVIDFLNRYLDSLILSESGVSIFLWQGVLHYTSEFFNREKIEMISHTQNSIWDKIFQKGDIIITLDHGITFPFEDVPFPKRNAKKMLMIKEKYRHHVQDSEDGDIDESYTEPSDDKFNILVEALSEVVKDYMGKKNPEI